MPCFLCHDIIFLLPCSRIANATMHLHNDQMAGKYLKGT